MQWDIVLVDIVIHKKISVILANKAPGTPGVFCMEKFLFAKNTSPFVSEVYARIVQATEHSMMRNITKGGKIMNKNLWKEPAVTIGNALLFSVNVQNNCGNLELTDESKR